MRERRFSILYACWAARKSIIVGLGWSRFCQNCLGNFSQTKHTSDDYFDPKDITHALHWLLCFQSSSCWNKDFHHKRTHITSILSFCTQIKLNTKLGGITKVFEFLVLAMKCRHFRITNDASCIRWAKSSSYQLQINVIKNRFGKNWMKMKSL